MSNENYMLPTYYYAFKKNTEIKHNCLKKQNISHIENGIFKISHCNMKQFLIIKCLS